MILAHRYPIFRHFIINDWEKSGKPLPPPHQLKQTIIEHYKSISGYNILVETGTYLGDMVAAQRKNFKQIYTIELEEKLYRRAVKRFFKYKNIKIFQGDSGKRLGDIIKLLKEPAIFWLDGHYSEGITARGEKDCPIFEEIDAISENKGLKHILLIDDARCFNGEGDYPTIDQLTDYINKKGIECNLSVENDIIRYFIT